MCWCVGWYVVLINFVTCMSVGVCARYLRAASKTSGKIGDRSLQAEKATKLRVRQRKTWFRILCLARYDKSPPIAQIYQIWHNFFSTNPWSISNHLVTLKIENRHQPKHLFIWAETTVTYSIFDLKESQARFRRLEIEIRSLWCNDVEFKVTVEL